MQNHNKRATAPLCEDKIDNLQQRELRQNKKDTKRGKKKKPNKKSKRNQGENIDTQKCVISPIKTIFILEATTLFSKHKRCTDVFLFQNFFSSQDCPRFIHSITTASHAIEILCLNKQAKRKRDFLKTKKKKKKKKKKKTTVSLAFLSPLFSQLCPFLPWFRDGPKIPLFCFCAVWRADTCA